MLNVVGIMVGPDIRSARLRSSRFATWAESLTAASSGGAAFGRRVLKSPPRSPKANAMCERLIGNLHHDYDSAPICV
jgi:hypothetical protein